MSFSLKINNIRESKTREYINEVIVSYEIGNYRSAIVSLYSVVIVDLYLKLNELIDVYNNQDAKIFLKKISEKSRYDSSRETELIDYFTKTNMSLSKKAIITIENIKNLRNLSAHPDFEPLQEELLSKPDQYIVAGLINECFSDIFCVSPFIGRNIFGFMLADISKRKSSFKNIEDEFDSELFDKFLCEKYFNNISEELYNYYTDQVFKIVFVTDNEETRENRIINYRILMCLFSKDKVKFLKVISKSNNLKHINYNDDMVYKLLLNFIFKLPELFKYINDSLQHKIQTNAFGITTYYVNKNFSNLSSYLKNLDEENLIYLWYEIEIIHPLSFQKYLKEMGLKDYCLKIAINTYTNSVSYNEADFNFLNWIEPNLNIMCVNDLINLIEKSSLNPQVYDRRAAFRDHKLIIDCLESMDSESEYCKREFLKSNHYSFARSLGI